MGYKELEVWKKSMDIAKDVYRLTQEFPASEQFGLTSQLRRAAVSVPTNIAEGYGRSSNANYIQFLRIAKGSVNEMETLLILAEQLQFAQTSALVERVAKVGSMLSNLIERIRPSSIAEEIFEYVTDQDSREHSKQ